MATKIAPYVGFDVSELPIGADRGSDIVGFDPVSRNLRPLVFRGSIGETEGSGQLYGDLLKKEAGQEFATAGDMAKLFNVYLSAMRGKAKPNPEQRKVLARYFDDIGQGNVCDTVVDFDNGDRSKPAPEGYKRVLLINRPELLVVEGGRILQAKGGERKPKLWPADGYVGRHELGSYDEDGVPRKTWPTREEAEATWPNETEDDKVFANAAVSYTWSREEGQGIAIVDRGFFSRGLGRFGLYAFRDPDDRGGGVGRVPLSR